MGAWVGRYDINTSEAVHKMWTERKYHASVHMSSEFHLFPKVASVLLVTLSGARMKIDTVSKC